jgi:hypothetical protein
MSSANSAAVPAPEASEDGGRPVYVIDSSALIDLRVQYPFKTFARLWQRFADLVSVGRLVAPDEVRHEIGMRDDELKAWAGSVDGLFRPPDDEFMAYLARVVAECEYLVRLSRPYSADPWVVALALQLHEAETDKLFPSPCRVVSHEVRVNQPGRRGIPDACNHFGLTDIRLVKVFEIERWAGH